MALNKSLACRSDVAVVLTVTWKPGINLGGYIWKNVLVSSYLRACKQKQDSYIVVDLNFRE